MDAFARTLQDGFGALPPRVWLAIFLAMVIPATALYALAGREAWRWSRRQGTEQRPHEDAALRAELDGANSQIQALIGELEELQTSYDALAASGTIAATQDVKRLSQRVDELLAENASLKRSLDQLRTQKAGSADDEVRRLNAQIASLTRQNRELERRLAEKGQDRSSAEREQDKAQITRLTDQVQELRDQLDAFAARQA